MDRINPGGTPMSDSKSPPASWQKSTSLIWYGSLLEIVVFETAGEFNETFDRR
jgi:hypothetical protein